MLWLQLWLRGWLCRGVLTPTPCGAFLIGRQVSLVEEAEMVFSTLSSCGRAVFSRLQRGFDLVLIDEAAQVGCMAHHILSMNS